MIYPIEIKGKTKNQVTKINLSGKGLREMPDNIFDYVNLEKLDLSHNKIKVIPKDIVRLRKLRSLDLSFNDLTVLQSALFKLPKLRTLNLHGNKLRSLPKQIAQSKLETLIISKNYFNEIDEALIKDIDKVDFVDNPMHRGLIEQTPIEVNVSKRKQMKKFNIFISYSHQDAEWLDKVKTHLKGLSHFYNSVDVWDDRRLRPSDKWKDEISKALASSNVALLLVSASFMASDFIQDNELQPILKNAESKGVKVIPIFVSPVSVIEESGLEDYQGANDPIKTLSECSTAEVERTLANLIDTIKSFIRE